ncbi:Uma2 family endonuclease [soil metagenome]
MATPMAVGFTVADLEAIPEDMVIRNLIDGELFVTPAPTTRHQRTVIRIIDALLDHAKAHGGEVLTAPCAVHLSDRDMPEPDVLFLLPGNLSRIGERYVVGPPDLVVEVSSPSTRRLDLVRKRRLYERFAVPEYWFVDLDADRFEVYVLCDGRYGAPLLVGFDDAVRATAIDGLVVSVHDILAM